MITPMLREHFLAILNFNHSVDVIQSVANACSPEKGRDKKPDKCWVVFLEALMQQCFMLFSFFETEYPLFVKEPPTHISAEMEKVVDIPCQARGQWCLFICVLVHVWRCKKVWNKNRRKSRKGSRWQRRKTILSFLCRHAAARHSVV